MAKIKDDDFLTVKTMRAILLETLGERLDSRLDRIEAKLETFNSLRVEITKQKEIVEKLEARIDDKDTYDRRNSIVFYNIPTKKNENALDLAVGIGRAVGINMSYSDIDATHRLKSRNDAAPPPFIIKLVNRWRRDDLMNATRKHKPDASWWGGAKEVRVFANEQLSPKNQAVLAEARKNKEFFFCWTWRGGVYCRPKLEGSQPQQLLNEEEARNMMSLISEKDREIITKANEEYKSKSKSRVDTPTAHGSQTDQRSNDGDGASGGGRSRKNNVNSRNRFNRSPYPSRRRD